MLTQIRTLRWWIWGLVCICNIQYGSAQELLVNVYGRQYTLLNGKWNAIIDPYQQGRKTAIYRNRALKDKADFKEYAFEGGLRLNVPSGIHKFQNLNITKERCGTHVNLR